MNGIILVSFSEMSSAVSSFGNEESQVRSITNGMLNTVDSMNGDWLGEAGSSYIRQFKKLRTDMNEMLRIIREYVDDLREMLKNYQEAESDIKGRVTGLETDVIKF